VIIIIINNLVSRGRVPQGVRDARRGPETEERVHGDLDVHGRNEIFTAAPRIANIPTGATRER